MSDNLDIMHRIKNVEGILKSHESNTIQLKKAVDSLKEIVQDLDKSMAIQSEKHSHLFYRIEHLQKEIEMLENSGEKTRGKQQDLIEKALMVFLGGLITYVYNLAGK